MKCIALAVALFAVSVDAGAQPPASETSAPAMATTAPVAQPQAAPAKPKLICRLEDTLGSRLGSHRECHTAAEWRAIGGYGAEELDQRQRAPFAPVGGR